MSDAVGSMPSFTRSGRPDRELGPQLVGVDAVDRARRQDLELLVDVAPVLAPRARDGTERAPRLGPRPFATMTAMSRRARLLIALVLVALVATSCRYTTPPPPPRRAGGVVAHPVVATASLLDPRARRRGPRPGDARRDGQGAAARGHRDRGRALLRARRVRRPRHPPGAHPQHREGPARRGRLDDHPAVRPRGDARQPEELQAQAARGRDGDAARGALLEEDDPRALPQHRLLRERRLRRAGRGPDVLRQGREGRRPRPGRAARRPHPRARTTTTRTSTPRPPIARRNEVLAKMHELHEIGDAEEALGQGAAGRRGPARRRTTATRRRSSCRR